MRSALVGVAAVLGLWASLCGPVQAQNPPKPGPQEPITLAGTDSGFDPLQPIKPGFQLSINTSSPAGPEPSMSGVFTVDGSGNISMPQLLGTVNLRGLTPPQAEDKLAGLLKPYVVQPKVSVSILSVPKPVVILSGAVLRGGSVTISDGTTLAELLTVAGFSDNCDLSRVRIVHRDEKNLRTTNEYDFLRWLKPNPGQKPDDTQNPVLQDRDLLYVPFKVLPGTGQVVVQGEVVRPGIVPLRVGVPVDLREALSLSGGPTPQADHRQVQVRRLGVEKTLIVDLDKAEAGDGLNNLILQPDDIIYVQKLAPDAFVNLNGAFVRPGRLPYSKPVMLTQVIADAGGLAPGARDFEGRVFRHVNGPTDPTKTQVIAFNYRQIRSNKASDLLIEPGDTVEIPQGAVPRPPLNALEMTQTALSLFLSFQYLFGRSRYY